MSQPTSEPTSEPASEAISEAAPEQEPASTATPIEDASKPTEEWVTGDEPMTGPQHSYLQTLAREAGRTLPDSLTKAQASDLIEELQAETGRGR